MRRHFPTCYSDLGGAVVAILTPIAFNFVRACVAFRVFADAVE